MTSSDDHLGELDQKLDEAASLLGECRRLLMGVKFEPETNIRRIADALTAIFAIQTDIYELRPDLTPDMLKPELDPTEES